MLCRILIILLVDSFVGNKLLSQSADNIWDDSEPFAQTEPSPDLKLPSFVVPSFYRLKLQTDIEKAKFRGEVYITIRATKPVKKITLHAQHLIVNAEAKLTEQIYEKVPQYHHKTKRQASNGTLTITETTLQENVANVSDATTEGAVDTNVTITTLSPTQNVTANNESIYTSENTVLSSSETPQPGLETQVTHSSLKNIKIFSVEPSSGDRLVLSLANNLKTGVDYILELSFEGNITDSLNGFYRSTYLDPSQKERYLGVTQFEPTYARAAFPCFDEPEFKAKFEISIAHPRNLSVLSNMKVATEEDMPERDNWQWTHFERSVNMSTYLVAYVISDFKNMETSYLSSDNVTKPIRIWAREELLHQAKYALSITPKLLEFYEELFGLPYALDKIDLVAIPEFASGAMENWGLVTFRESALLFNEVDGRPTDKQSVAISVAHELAHQWFGNLVTMKWWTDLWLNEGFATYIEYVGVDKIQPDWKMFESFVQDKMDLFRRDALKNTSPVSKTVGDASEISQKFDQISYLKGANLIRMLNHTITGELFRKGLMIYLNEWKYKNAEENDLWLALTAATQPSSKFKDLSVLDFMNSWTKQTGLPVVNVIRDYGTPKVKFEQKLFTVSNNPYSSVVNQIWQIPLTYATLGSEELVNDEQLWLKERSASFDLNMTANDALYVNVDAIGYYRVNYDQRNWELLRDALKKGLVKSQYVKSQLIDDAFNLAKATQLNYSYALDLVTFVKDGEESKIVWDLVFSNLYLLKSALRPTSGFSYFQDYVRTLISKQIELMNFGLDEPKDDNEAMLISSLLKWECDVEVPRCLDWVRDMFRRWELHGNDTYNPIPRHLRSLVFDVSISRGGRREFSSVWRLFSSSADPGVKALAISHLGRTRDESLTTFLLERSLDTIPKQYAESAWIVDSTIGSKVARDFLVNNWERVYRRFTALDPLMMQQAISGAFDGIATQDELDKFKSFALKHKEELKPMSKWIQSMVDVITFKIDWIQKHAAPVTLWMKNYVEGKLDKTETTTPRVPTTEALKTVNSSHTEATDNITTEKTPPQINRTEVNNSSIVP